MQSDPASIQARRRGWQATGWGLVLAASWVLACKAPDYSCDEGHGAISLHVDGVAEEAVCVTALRGDLRVEEGWSYIKLHAKLDHDPEESLHEPMVLCEFELPLGPDYAPLLGSYPVVDELVDGAGNCRFRAASEARTPATADEWVSTSGQLVIASADGARLAGHLAAQMVSSGDPSETLGGLQMNFELKPQAVE